MQSVISSFVCSSKLLPACLACVPLRALLLGLPAHRVCVSRLLTASPPSSVEMRMNLICFRIHMMRKKRSSRSIVMGLMLLLCRMAQEQSPRREQIQEP